MIIGPGESGGRRYQGIVTGTMTDSAATEDAAHSTVPPVSLAALLAHVEAVVVAIDLDGAITFLSPAARAVLGYEPSMARGRQVTDFMHPDEEHRFVEFFDYAMAGTGLSTQPTVRVRHSDGSWIPMTLDLWAGPEVAPFGAVIATLKPVGEVTAAELELRVRLASEDRLVRLASTFLGLDLDGFDLGVNNALAQLGGLPGVDRCTVMRRRGDVVVKTHQWCSHRARPSNRDEVPMAWLEGRFGPDWNSELYFEVADHLGIVDIEGLREMDDDGIRSTLSVPIRHDDGFAGFVAFSSSEVGRLRSSEFLSLLRTAAGLLGEAFARHDAEVELARRARTDVLTGLDNRWAFIEAVAGALEQLGDTGDDDDSPRPHMGLLLLDLDRFKVVNDSLGHVTGDHLLAAVAERLHEQIRPDEHMGRMGGDEVMLLLRASDPADIGARADQMLWAFDEPFALPSGDVSLTASGGLVIAHPGDSPEELLSRADAAMFRAKETGRARLEVFDDALRSELSRRFRLEGELRQARSRGEMELHFQPELHLPTRTIHGVEALVRWNHPVEGRLSAAEFIPIAEESGLIVDLGRWVFATACQQLADWQERGWRPVMRVNLSARQLNHPDVVEDITLAIRSSGADPSLICLELTETAVMADADRSLEVLGKLAGLGLHLAIDDFGTGYSSLSYLKRLPMDVLKVDRSFVDGLGRSSDDEAIVTAIISLASTLGLTVTAEGIETPAQLETLLSLGCRFGQGWLFAPALSAGEVEDLLSQDQPFG